MLLELENIYKSYQRGGWFGRGDKVAAVKGVSLTVPEGGRVGLIGRSGAGKSSLCRLLLGLEKADSGIMRYRGTDTRSFDKTDWRRFRGEVQVVFQNALGSVNPRWRAQDILLEPVLNFHRLSDRQQQQKTAELLHLVGLDATDADKYPRQFSGGQLQRICIARALALQPKLVILDEAVSSLDMVIQAEILTLLKRLQVETGVSYLFVSHDIRIVAGFCDSVAVMHQGAVTSQVTDLTEAALSTDPVLSALAQAILPAWPKQMQANSGLRNYHRAPPAGTRQTAEVFS